MNHPRQHLWQALQRRFGDQNKPTTAAELLVRGLKIVPLDGQENSAVYALGFLEAGAVRRTASLSKDFGSVAALVQPDASCYLAVFIGDVQAQTASADPKAQWVLISYVPSTCSTKEIKKMADNRAALKAGLGASSFTGDMWCSSADQITLSTYLRSAEGGVGSGPPPPGGAAAGADNGEQAARDAAAAKLQGKFRTSRRTGPGMDAAAARGGGGAGATAASTAAAGDAGVLWDQRIAGARTSYLESCKRLVGALEELEQTLCGLTGDEYRADHPLLHARAHMLKKIELGQSAAYLK